MKELTPCLEDQALERIRRKLFDFHYMYKDSNEVNSFNNYDND